MSRRAQSPSEDGVLIAKQVTVVKTAPGSAGNAKCGYVTMGITRETASYSGIQADTYHLAGTRT